MEVRSWSRVATRNRFIGCARDFCYTSFSVNRQGYQKEYYEQNKEEVREKSAQGKRNRRDKFHACSDPAALCLKQ